MSQAKTEWKYKKRKSFVCRKEESQKIRSDYPNSIPVVLEKSATDGTPTAQKEKYLIPKNLTVADFVLMVRRNMFLHSDKSVVLAADFEVLHSSLKMGEVYDCKKDTDGFLYLSYSTSGSYTYTKDSYGRVL